MAIAFVKAAQNFTIGSPTSLTVTIATSAGALLVCYVRQANDQTSTWTVADSSAQGNWTQTSGGYTTSAADNFRGAMHFIPNSAAVTTVTATFSGAVTNPNMVVMEFSGVATSSAVDATQNGNSLGSAISTITSGSLSTSIADTVLVFGVCLSADGGGFTQGSGYTIPTNGTSNNRVAMEYKIVSSIQSNVTATMTCTTAQTEADVFTAFKAASTAFVDEDYKWDMQLLPSEPSITIFQ